VAAKAIDSKREGDPRVPQNEKSSSYRQDCRDENLGETREAHCKEREHHDTDSNTWRDRYRVREDARKTDSLTYLVPERGR